MAPSGSTEVTTAFCMMSQMCMPITMTLFASGKKPLGYVEAAVRREGDFRELAGVDDAEELEPVVGRRGAQLLFEIC